MLFANFTNSILYGGEWAAASTVCGKTTVFGFGQHDTRATTYYDSFSGDLSLSEALEATLVRVPKNVKKVTLTHIGE